MLSHSYAKMRFLHEVVLSDGEVAEWLKAAASKAVVLLRGTAGSNPALSAITFVQHVEALFRGGWGICPASDWVRIGVEMVNFAQGYLFEQHQQNPFVKDA